MTKSTVRECISLIIGTLCSIFVVHKWVTPTYDLSPFMLTFAEVTLIVLFALSFTVTCFTLLGAFYDQSVRMRWAFFGLLFPAYVCFLTTLLENLTTVDFWFVLGISIFSTVWIGGLIGALLGSPINKSPVHSSHKEDEEQTSKPVSVHLPHSIVADFAGHERVQQRVKSFLVLLEEVMAKQTGATETEHELEKIVRQFEKSKETFFHIGTRNHEQAETLFLAILEKMEVKLLSHIDAYEQQELGVLERILKQQ